ncbi:MAG: hypothetical protein GEV28_36925 [Actinophytocola sp.]|uniref:hypothetical protein n=1 Tax=Actinophytocola sp. TaxID=1872138 RepID=UPI00132B9A21|nr:hypothetical protein [Actinophytocola sp.]MPZ85668.1 hypothetical protein [Actinophytocola sp.]
MKRAVLVGLALIGGFGVAGCGVDAGAPPAPGEPKLGAIPTVARYADVEFPLDRFRTRPEEFLMLSRAHDVVVRDCLARFGIGYVVPERVLVPDVDRPVGVVSVDDAARFGYESPFAADVAAVDEANAAVEPLSGVARGVLRGDGQRTVDGVTVPVDGCVGEARRALVNRNPDRENVVVGLAADSYAMAEADSRVRAVFTGWSRCMSAAGFDYRDPWAANNDPAFGTGVPTAEEIATAKADVACRTEENVNGVWVAVITAYQERLVTEHRDVLNQRRDEIETQLVAATDLLDA